MKIFINTMLIGFGEDMAIILIIIIFLGFFFFTFAINGIRLADNIFACPNCGHHFKPKWYNMMFVPGRIFLLFNKANLKCPKCKTRDTCSIPN